MDTHDGTIAAPPPVERNELSRIVGVFFEPASAFADITNRGHWIVPFVLAIAAGVILIVAFGQHVGWERTVRRQIESNPRMADMPAAQRERAVQAGAKVAPAVAIGGVVVGTPIIYAIFAGILLLILRSLLNVGLGFRQVWAVLCYAALPRVLAGILGIGVMFLKSPEDFDIRNPLAFNPAAFMDPDTSSKFVYTLASALDFFTLWYLLLIAIGLKAAAGRRLSFGGAILTVGVPWLAFIFIRAGIAAAFG